MSLFGTKFGFTYLLNRKKDNYEKRINIDNTNGF